VELAFTKLFNKIVTSSVWSEDDKTRIMWITLLAISDRHGYVAAALPGLADVARMSLEEAKKAIHNLESKDEYSRNKILDGRRILPVEGGWEIVTYESHRKLLSKEERKAYKAEWIARKRRQERRQKSTTVDSESTLSTQAEAEAEKEAERSTSPNPSLKGGEACQTEMSKAVKTVKRALKTYPHGIPDSEWIEELANDSTYSGIDVKREFGKMTNWCKVKQITPTRRRFINWLNRAEKPMQSDQKQFSLSKGFKEI